MPNSMSQITLIDIAEKALVSKATVSRVLNGKDNVRNDLRLAVFRAATELGYVTNPKIVGSVRCV